MVEIELKLQVPDAARRAVEAWVGAVGGRREHLVTTYFDTPEHALAAAGLALRIRKQGRRRVQALKGPGADAMQRFEHEVELPFAAGPLPDAARHAGTPCGERLAQLLAAGEGSVPELQAQFQTDIWRRTRPLRVRGGSVEIAHDSGAIVAGGQRQPVHEVEVELASGDPSAVVEVAQRLMLRHGLWLDVASKAERGARLALHRQHGPAARACALQLDDGMDAEAALRAVVGNCLAQILPNASEIARGSYGDEHVHQLRVGLRRLRTALRFFGGWVQGVPESWNERLAALFRGLGLVRDRDALAASLLPSLQAAGAPMFDLPAVPEGPSPTELMRGAEANALWLELIAWRAAPPVLHEPAQRELREKIARRLGRWHRRVVHAGRRWEELDDTARHQLRKRAKRLRYAAEFAASQHEPEAVARFLARLAPVQDCLGRYNDLCVALETYRAAVGDEARAWFAIGWLTARRDVLLAESGAALKDFARSKPYWKGR